jgi:hypothetical protein
VNETYLEAGRRGKNTWLRYLLGFVFILFMWFVAGGWASLSLGSLLNVSVGQIATEPSSAGLIAGYLVLGASFPFFLLGTLLAAALIHRRNPLTLVTGTGKRPPPSGQTTSSYMSRAGTPWPATSSARGPSSNTTDGSSPSWAAPWS